MPAHPLTLGGISFAKKGDALQHLKEMLNRYDPGDRVASGDAEVLKDALARHPEAIKKVGAGVESFSVRSADYGTGCFWVNRVDGSTEDFSYKSCIYDRR